MILRLFSMLKKASLYAKNHPQILFALMLLIVIPLLFLYTGQQFLDVGKANQDKLQKDRIGLMHDSIAALVAATNFDVPLVQKQLDRISQLNPDLVDYKLLIKKGNDVVPLIAKGTEATGTPETNIDFYRNASLRNDESIIFESYTDNVRLWSAYRAIETQDGTLYFLYTKFSMEQIDLLFAEREQRAYFSLVFVYCFVIALAYWHIKLTDYRYLYLKAQKANEMKDLFTNMIAHELRAPLTAIRGYAAMIDERTIDSEEKKYAQRVSESAERLIAIVNDLLDVARIQSGKLSVTPRECDVSKLLKTVIEELQVTASEKHVSLHYEGADTPHILFIDEKRLHQAITNLVSNSIKYTEKGTIILTVEDTHAFIEIRVKDTGMGIASEDQQKLFAPFFRVANTDVSKITGTGLGMWITKQLIELMDGTIGVESIKGVGTHVVVKLKKDIRIS